MLPQPGKGKGLPGLETDKMRNLAGVALPRRRFRAARLGLPFEETVRKDEAAVILIGGPESRFFRQRFGAGIDEAAADGRVLGPGGDQSPDKEIDMLVASLGTTSTGWVGAML